MPLFIEDCTVTLRVDPTALEAFQAAAMQAAAAAPTLTEGLTTAALDQITEDPVLARHHRTAAVRAHLLELAGDRAGARQHYRLAARLTLSRPEQRYLESRAAQLR